MFACVLMCIVYMLPRVYLQGGKIKMTSRLCGTKSFLHVCFYMKNDISDKVIYTFIMFSVLSERFVTSNRLKKKCSRSLSWVSDTVDWNCELCSLPGGHARSTGRRVLFQWLGGWDGGWGVVSCVYCWEVTHLQVGMFSLIDCSIPGIQTTSTGRRVVSLWLVAPGWGGTGAGWLMC